MTFIQSHSGASLSKAAYRKQNMKHHILCINSGSSSIKFALYLLGATETVLASGAVEQIGLPGGWLWLKDGGNNFLEDSHKDFPDHSEAVRTIFDVAVREQLPVPDAVGHRLALGGLEHIAPEVVTPELMQKLQSLIPLAPIHLPAEIKGVEAVTEHYPKLKQVACFDTSFHRRIPGIAQMLPVPRSLSEEGIQRFGFHGLSYEYIVGALGKKADGRVIIAHLGNGASMAALKNGRPQDTTMGFSPLGGLMMGTRSGDLDPGILLYLLKEKDYDKNQLEEMLYHQSGLAGVSGITSDMKTLLDQRGVNLHAAEAVELFCYTARKYIGALSTVIGGLDTLVFTGGIGERAAPVRAMICHNLEYLGIRLNPAGNNAHADIISAADSICTVRVIPTNEDLMIARHTRTLLSKNWKEE